MLKLTDGQLLLLSKASQRRDGLVEVPENLKGGALKAVLGKLLSHQLIKEMKVARGLPVWRRTDDEAFGLEITPAGLKAINADAEEPSRKASAEAPRQKSTARGRPRPSPRGSKREAVLSLLKRSSGASLKELMKATGWLAHSTRAALSGLRKSGVSVVRHEKTDGTSAYRVIEKRKGGSTAGKGR
jgi:hypothetical protein